MLLENVIPAGFVRLEPPLCASSNGWLAAPAIAILKYRAKPYAKHTRTDGTYIYGAQRPQFTDWTLADWGWKRSIEADARQKKNVIPYADPNARMRIRERVQESEKKITECRTYNSNGLNGVSAAG